MGRSIYSGRTRIKSYQLKVVVTGATGFVGRHVVGKLVQSGFQVTVVVRDDHRAKVFNWYEHVRLIQANLQIDYSPVLKCLPKTDVLIHLAWPGLPNFQDNFHVFKNLRSDLNFLKACVETGLTHLVVAGTCLEYGLQSGALTESMDTHPITPYGFAKDSLRKSLQFLQRDYSFILQWMRLFYMFGDGQNPKSLIPQLDLAIDQKKSSFDMSTGNQLRDYLSIEDVATNILLAVKNPSINGIVNNSSGSPISILDLVRNRCQERNSNIHLNLGCKPLPEYEPLEFWGVPTKLNSLCR